MPEPVQIISTAESEELTDDKGQYLKISAFALKLHPSHTSIILGSISVMCLNVEKKACK